ncbi:MAG: hypothetical protein ABII22_03470 [Candidatus Micrarchaeota archaeon]
MGVVLLDGSLAKTNDISTVITLLNSGASRADLKRAIESNSLHGFEGCAQIYKSNPKFKEAWDKYFNVRELLLVLNTDKFPRLLIPFSMDFDKSIERMAAFYYPINPDFQRAWDSYNTKRLISMFNKKADRDDVEAVIKEIGGLQTYVAKYYSTNEEFKKAWDKYYEVDVFIAHLQKGLGPKTAARRVETVGGLEVCASFYYRLNEDFQKAWDIYYQATDLLDKGKFSVAQKAKFREEVVLELIERYPKLGRTEIERQVDVLLKLHYSDCPSNIDRRVFKLFTDQNEDRLEELQDIKHERLQVLWDSQKTFVSYLSMTWDGVAALFTGDFGVAVKEAFRTWWEEHNGVSLLTSGAWEATDLLVPFESAWRTFIKDSDRFRKAKEDPSPLNMLIALKEFQSDYLNVVLGLVVVGKLAKAGVKAGRATLSKDFALRAGAKDIDVAVQSLKEQLKRKGLKGKLFEQAEKAIDKSAALFKQNLEGIYFPANAKDIDVAAKTMVDQLMKKKLALDVMNEATRAIYDVAHLMKQKAASEGTLGVIVNDIDIIAQSFKGELRQKGLSGEILEQAGKAIDDLVALLKQNLEGAYSAGRLRYALNFLVDAKAFPVRKLVGLVDDTFRRTGALSPNEIVNMFLARQKLMAAGSTQGALDLAARVEKEAAVIAGGVAEGAVDMSRFSKKAQGISAEMEKIKMQLKKSDLPDQQKSLLEASLVSLTEGLANELRSGNTKLGWVWDVLERGKSKAGDAYKRLDPSTRKVLDEIQVAKGQMRTLNNEINGLLAESKLTEASGKILELMQLQNKVYAHLVALGVVTDVLKLAVYLPRVAGVAGYRFVTTNSVMQYVFTPFLTRYLLFRVAGYGQNEIQKLFFLNKLESVPKRTDADLYGEVRGLTDKLVAAAKKEEQPSRLDIASLRESLDALAKAPFLGPVANEEARLKLSHIIYTYKLEKTRSGSADEAVLKTAAYIASYPGYMPSVEKESEDKESLARTPVRTEQPVKEVKTKPQTSQFKMQKEIVDAVLGTLNYGVIKDKVKDPEAYEEIYSELTLTFGAVGKEFDLKFADSGKRRAFMTKLNDRKIIGPK